MGEVCESNSDDDPSNKNEQPAEKEEKEKENTRDCAFPGSLANNWIAGRSASERRIAEIFS